MTTDTHDLDTFETALLTELRTVVADRRPVRRTRRLTLAGVAASTAAIVGVGFAVGGSSPAFAVHQDSAGDITVTINRLDDATGLEHALAAQGVTADVDYAHPIRLKTTDGKTVDVIPNGGRLNVIPERAFEAAQDPNSKRVVVVQRGEEEGGDFTCDFGKGGNLTLAAVKGGYVLTIPHASVLTKTPLHITTSETSDHHATLAVGTHQDRCIQIASSSGS